MPKSQVFFWLLVSFIAGIGVASFVSPVATLVAAAFGFGGALAAFAEGRAVMRPRLLVAGVAIMAYAFGMAWFMQSQGAPSPLLGAAVGEKMTLEGVLRDEPIRQARSQQLVLSLTPNGERLRVTARPYPEYRYGDVLRVSGRLEEPENFSEDFDYRAYLAKDDIYFTMAFPEITVHTLREGNPVMGALLSLKRVFSDGLGRHLPEPHASFLAGLILGERRGLPETLTEDLRRTGTSHLVALSGYNITIVADAMMRLLSFLRVPIAGSFWGAVGGIAAFSALTGAAASVVRAAIMGVLVLIARRTSRIYRMQNALAFAGAAMLFANPKLLRFDVGFQLSFLATVGLIYGVPVVERVYERVKIRLALAGRDTGLIREDREERSRGERRGFLRGIFLSTIAAQLAVLPLLIAHFGTLSLVSPFANLAVLPLIPATMLAGFFTGAAALISDVASAAIALASWALLEGEIRAIGFFAGMPLAALEVPGVGAAFLVIGYAAGYLWWRRRTI